MSEQDDFQTRVEDLKAEVDAEIAQDQRRRFTWFGFRRSGAANRLLDGFAIGTMIWLLTFAGFVGAIAIGLGVSIKTALVVAAIAAIAALTFAAMSG